MQVQDLKQKCKVIRKIGKGVYGTVYLVQLENNGNYLALKRTTFESGCIPDAFIHEVFILKSLKHKNIITIHDAFVNESAACLFMPYVGDNLHVQMKDKKCVLDTKNIMKQLLLGIQYIHSRGFIHRDIKPQNIMLSPHGIIQYIDFGLACRKFCIRKTHTVITRWYRPPEILLGSKTYGTEIDIWSLGCVFAELLTCGIPLFPGNDVENMLFRIRKVCNNNNSPFKTLISDRYEKKHKFSSSESNLLEQMLNLNCETRINASEALNHSYFL